MFPFCWGSSERPRLQPSGVLTASHICAEHWAQGITGATDPGSSWPHRSLGSLVNIFQRFCIGTQNAIHSREAFHPTTVSWLATAGLDDHRHQHSPAEGELAFGTNGANISCGGGVHHFYKVAQRTTTLTEPNAIWGKCDSHHATSCTTPTRTPHMSRVVQFWSQMDTGDDLI